MIGKSYCVNVAVSDLEAATRRFEEILGHDAIAMDQVFGPGGKTPGTALPVGGMYYLGLVSTAESPSATSDDLVARHLAIRGEGACMVGLLVDDIDAQADRLAKGGVRTTSTKPFDTALGRSLFTDAEQTGGTVLQFTQLEDPAATEQLWSDRARAATRRRAYQAYVLDIAVGALDACAALYKSAFGFDPIPMPEGADPSDSMDATHFTVGGPAENGVGGLYAIGLMTPRGAPKGPIPQAVNDYLDAHGDGSFLVAFLTENLEEQIDHLRSLGIGLCYDEPMRYVHGRLQMTEPVHGVWLDFAQHDHDAFERWQSGE